MCLAKVYVRAAATDAPDEFVMENVSRVVVDDGRVLVTSILRETEDCELV